MNSPKKINVIISGASFNTGNLGVSALAESSIISILNLWPNAQFYSFGSSRTDSTTKIIINKQKHELKDIPVRFSYNIFLKNHFIRYFFNIIFLKLLPFRWNKNRCIKNNRYIKTILESKIVFDITGGDSFSDIYGKKRFILDFLRKWLLLLYEKKIVFLPQTYGPFKNKIIKKMGLYILNKASLIFSRDEDGITFLTNNLNSEKVKSQVYLIPDVAFLLKPETPSKTAFGKDVVTINALKKTKHTIIGLNISGLLYNGGYTKNNMFNLKSDYKSMIQSIIEYFLSKKGTTVLLIPHVFPHIEYTVESDPSACKKVFDSFPEIYKNRLFYLQETYDHKQIKSIIGKCDFFLGSRMHSCIAALSQHIPTIGLAYSKKFIGVFSTIEMYDSVIDLTKKGIDDIIKDIDTRYKKRKQTHSSLKIKIPHIKKEILASIKKINI